MKIRLHWKLTFVFCSVCVLVFSSVYGYLITHLQSYFENNLISNLKHELFLARDLVVVSSNTDNHLDTQSLAVNIGHILGVRATIVTPAGTVAGDSDLNKEQLREVENHKNRPEVQEAFRKGFGLSKRFSHTIKKYMIYMAVPFAGQKSEGVLRLAVPLKDVELLESGIWKIVGLSLVFVLFASLVVTSIIAAFVSRPLTQMADVAKAMAKGDFSRETAVRSKDEIGDLAHALNTMSKEIEEKMETVNAERTKLDLVLSSMSEGVVVTDDKERIVLMNPSLRKIFFVDMRPEGRNLMEVVRNTALQDILQRILAGKQRFCSEEIIVNLPEKRVLKINAVPIAHGGSIEGAVFVFHDITELRNLEQIRQDFVANVSHELRTPVSSIRGYAETLLEGGLQDKEHARKFVEIIYQDSSRLAGLINDLLDLAKIESGKMNMVFLPTAPVPVLKRVLSIIETQAKGKSITLTFGPVSSLPHIKADEMRLSQVLINLLDNAVKYTPEHGVVTIHAQVVESALQIDIIDTGIGIPEKDLPRIFERFYRIDRARSRELGGTGLGLSIVKHIVQAHGGNVWAVSEPGKGSTFSFTIPLA